MSCKKTDSKKYLSRPSPPYPANKCCGERKVGNDGTYYKSVPNFRGICRWVKIPSAGFTLKTKKSKTRKTKAPTKRKTTRKAKKTKRTTRRKTTRTAKKTKRSQKNSTEIDLMNTLKGRKYTTLDNGGRPFLVVITPKSVTIAKAAPWDPEDPDKTVYEKIVKTYNNVDKIFVGKSPHNRMTDFSGGYGPGTDGSSILLKLKDKKNHYVFVGSRIYDFVAPEPITKYFSSIGNSSVPYPVAVSKSYIYFMIEEPNIKYMDIKDFQKSEDVELSNAYNYFYDSKPKTKTLRVHVIQKRL